MRKTSTKKDSRISHRLLAICVSVCMILGSMSALAFADEEDAGEDQAEQPAVVSNEDAQDKAPATEENDSEAPAANEDEDKVVADDDSAADEDAVVDEDTDADVDADADADTDAEPAAAASQGGQSAGTEISGSSAKAYGASVGTIFYNGTTPSQADRNQYYTYSGYTGAAFNLNNASISNPNYSNNGTWRYSNLGVIRNGRVTTYVSVAFTGTSTNQPIGIKVASGSGTSDSPFVLEPVYHEHNWTVTANGARATISCSAAHCSIRTYPTVTIAAPTSEGYFGLQYDGKAHAATTTTRNPVSGLDINISIKYEGTGDTTYSSTDAPVDAGTYKATATVTVGNSKDDISVNFTISKAWIWQGITTPTDIVDDLTNLNEIMLPEGGKVELCVAGTAPEGSEFQYSLDGETWSKDVPTASKPGEYTVSYKLVPDKNHQIWGEYSGEIEALVMNYEFTEGADASWEMDSEDTLTFVVKRSREDGATIDRFADLYVDGELVEEANYSKEPGSVKITLTNAYLKTLKEGSHKVELSFSEGDSLTYKVSSTFTVKAAPTPAPQTGEYAGAFVLVISALMVAAGTAFVIKARKA